MSLKSFPSLLWSSLLDLLFPNYCLACGSLLIGNHKLIVCSSCWKELFYEYEGEKCLTCGLPLEFLPGANGLCRRCLERKRKFHFDGVNFFSIYQGLPEVLVKEMKFKELKPLAGLIGERIAEHLKAEVKRRNVDLVVPVPLSERTLKERGFNQSEEILKGAGVKFTPAVEKVYETGRQSAKDRKNRWENVKGAFKIKANFTRKIFGKRILLFDDVFTTGATANEISGLLKRFGAFRVFVYTVCYTPTARETEEMNLSKSS